MLSCCRHTFNWKLKDRQPVEGETMDCRWGGETWLYTNGAWVEQPPWDPRAVCAYDDQERGSELGSGRIRMEWAK